MSTSLMPVARQRYFDSNGRPLAGGLLYTYASGTSTPKATFTDSAETTPHANPVVLDVNGEALIFWNGAYRVNVTSAIGVQIPGYPVDNYISANVAVEGAKSYTDILRADLLAQSGASLIGWFQAGAGAIYQILANKLRELFSFRDFGAIGNGSDETSKLQLAATRRGGDGFGQSELTLPPGDYFVSAAPVTPAITLNSDTYVRGTGGQLRAGLQNFYMLWSSAKSNIRIDNMKMVAGSTAGNDAQAAIYAECDSATVTGYAVTFNSLIDTSWGALVQAQVGTGKFIGPRFIGNFVQSTTPGTKADGLHMVGNVIAGVMVGNAVHGRADAGGAMNAIAGNTGYGNVMAASAHIDCLVGVDISGSQFGVVCGINARNIVDHTASNPCVRAIRYEGSDPKYHIINAVMALGTHASSGEYDVKVDAQGADTHIQISAHMLQTFWTNARFVNITGNHFIGNAQVHAANYAGEIFIGPNTFEASFDFYGAGNPALQGNVYVARQNWTRQAHLNFLPNYSTAAPFWAFNWFFEADRTPVITATNTVTSTLPVDIPGGLVVLDRACVLDGIVGLADLSSHSGHISLCDLSNNELARVDFPVTAPLGGTNVACVLTGPTQSGNVYKIRLPPGTYKLRYWSDLGSITLKNASLMLWS